MKKKAIVQIKKWIELLETKVGDSTGIYPKKIIREYKQQLVALKYMLETVEKYGK